MDIPPSFIEARSMAFGLDPKLFEAGVVHPTSKAVTGLIPGSGKGRPCTNDPNGLDFVSIAHTRHPKLTKFQVESTLMSMRNRAI